MTISLPPPIPGIPFDVETADSRVAGYRLGEHRRVIQPGAVRAPLAFIFGDHPRFTDPAAAEALLTENDHLEQITIELAGDLPQLERPDETAAVVEGFLA